MKIPAIYYGSTGICIHIEREEKTIAPLGIYSCTKEVCRGKNIYCRHVPIGHQQQIIEERDKLDKSFTTKTT